MLPGSSSDFSKEQRNTITAQKFPTYYVRSWFYIYNIPLQTIPAGMHVNTSILMDVPTCFTQEATQFPATAVSLRRKKKPRKTTPLSYSFNRQTFKNNAL